MRPIPGPVGVWFSKDALQHWVPFFPLLVSPGQLLHERSTTIILTCHLNKLVVTHASSGQSSFLILTYFILPTRSNCFPLSLKRRKVWHKIFTKMLLSLVPLRIIAQGWDGKAGSSCVCKARMNPPPPIALPPSVLHLWTVQLAALMGVR